MKPRHLGKRTAIWSGNGTEDSVYRYYLEIVWHEASPLLMMLMMNPSKADEFVTDPTVDRCCERARRLGFGGLVVLNAFAFRATEPKDMLAAADPVGPKNDAVIRAALDVAAAADLTVMVGWGQHGAHRGRDKEVWAMFKATGITPVCLGVAQNGQPVHPLYQSYDQPFRPWAPPV